MRAARRWACVGMLACGCATAADLEITRVEHSVVLRGADGGTRAAAVRGAVATGDTLLSGPGAHAGVRLAGGGSLTLGSDARLHLLGSEGPEPPGRAALARLRLESGAIRVDARKQGTDAPADVRLAFRYLQARLYGTEAWAEVSAAGDELCIVSGAAEIDTPDGHRRLDTAGECLRWTASGGQQLRASEVGNLLPRLSRTTFSDDYASRYAAEQARRDGSARPTLAEQAAVAAPPAAAAADTIRVIEVPRRAADAPAVSAAPARWRIALGTFVNRANAERSAAEWRKRRLQTDIETIELNGRPAYRLLCGRYASREEGEQALARLRERPGYEDARVIAVGAR